MAGLANTFFLLQGGTVVETKLPAFLYGKLRLLVSILTAENEFNFVFFANQNAYSLLVKFTALSSGRNRQGGRICLKYSLKMSFVI